MKSRLWSSRWHRLAFGALVILVAFLIVSPAFKNVVDGAAIWTIRFAEMHPFRGAIIFVLFSALSAMLAFASSAVLVPPATFAWGKLGAFLLLWSGWTLGAAAAYCIGRLATPLLVRLGYEKKLERYQQFVSSEMGFRSVLLFCLAVPSEVPGYLFGGAHYGFWKFILAMALAEALYAYVLVVAGESLRLVQPSFLFTVAGIAIVIAVLLAFVIRMLKKPSIETTASGRKGPPRSAK